ncbi:glycosyltransferase, partial [Vibrio harveyi]|uniref:glycosyltransferase n=1 Tax=Vibrio harveyi TaxID=669 RepID=UPI000680D0A1
YSHFSSPFLFLFLARLKLKNIKIVCEVPTFPYDLEYLSVSGFSKWKFYLDKLFRKVCFRFFDAVVTFSSEEQIFGIDTIRISNAVENRVLEREVPSLYPDVFSLVLIANMQYWHGIDRLIKSVFSYYSNKRNSDKDIRVTIIGGGELLDELISLTKKLNLCSVVEFKGELNGNELYEILDNSSVGIDSLGRHRSSIETNNSLKSKEYLAFGLPIIKSHKDDSLDNTEFSRYVYNVAPNDDDFNISHIISWFENGGFDRKKISNEAKNRFSWANQVDAILKEI